MSGAFIEVNTSHGDYEISLSRVPCVGELIAFRNPKDHKQRLRVRVESVMHLDAIEGGAVVARIEAVLS